MRHLKTFPYWVDRIGVELEGFFATHRHTKGNPPYGQWAMDGSIEGHYTGFAALELRSKPFNSWKKLHHFLWEQAPDLVNPSCGTHAHVSFKDLVVFSTLAQYNDKLLSFTQEHMRKYIDKYKHILTTAERKALIDRINNRNSYTRMEAYASRQLQGNGGRYTAYNFSAYQSHGTLEFRLLPAFEKTANLVRTLEYWLGTILPSFLRQYALKSRMVLKTELTYDDMGIQHKKAETKQFTSGKLILPNGTVLDSTLRSSNFLDMDNTIFNVDNSPRSYPTTPLVLTPNRSNSQATIPHEEY